MAKLIDEFRTAGRAYPSLHRFLAWACGRLHRVVDRGAWCLSQIRPDVFFTPYFPAVFFATAFGGYRVGIPTAIAGGLLGVIVNFSERRCRSREVCAAAHFLGGVRADDLGRRALPDDRAQQREDRQAPDPGRGIPQARGRRIAAPAEKQNVDDPRRAAPGAAGSAADLGQHRSAGFAHCPRPTI